ncbi:MAG: type II toxin-antitoxin system RelE/ParE family toxin [Candidatus Methylumidiphilus sp.]
MSKVTWSKDALQDIDRLFAFLFVNSPNAAHRSSESIISAAKKLENFPQIGKPM